MLNWQKKSKHIRLYFIRTQKIKYMRRTVNHYYFQPIFFFMRQLQLDFLDYIDISKIYTKKEI